MGQKRTIVLDNDELIMIVGKDVVGQIDENRGEMTRTEFVNFLIQSQLEKFRGEQDYITKQEFRDFAQGIKELFSNFLEFFLSYSLSTGEQPPDNTLEELSQQLQSLENPDDETENL